jgi:predicted DNA repair protein MutK
VDDTAVTPQYVQGVAAERELPIIKKIAIGSIRNKLLLILPAALLLSELLPSLLKIILMCGGAYLCYEGAEKIWEKFGPGHGHHDDEALEKVAAGNPAETEKTLISGAIRTDLILSAEIMVISLDEVAGESFWSRAAIMVVVAFFITAVVYGVVALIVKMDDVGLSLAQRSSAVAQRVGRGLVQAMPRVLEVIGAVGTAAMLWVGGHIVLVGSHDLGWHAPYDVVHHLEEAVHDATGALGSVLGWVTNTGCSAVLGLVIGAVLVAVMHLVPRRNAH